jgi:hypothetical protein
MKGFSFASVILSYFLVAGGLFAGTLVSGLIENTNQIMFYALLAAGAFVGGFVAARASRGSTILEPAIGAVAVVVTVVALAYSTALGKMIWAVARDETTKLVAGVGLSSMLGALGGAFVSEKVFGEATESSLPWIIYTALSIFGACLLAMLIVAGLMHHETDEYKMGAAVFAAIGIGCILGGICVGASARTRPLLAALFGGTIGTFGFFMLLFKMTGGAHDKTSEVIAGFAIIAFGGGIVTLLGALVGWGTVGKNATS